MYEHIGIRVPQQTGRVVYAYTAQPQVATLYKAVHIKSHSYTHFHRAFLFYEVFNAFEVKRQCEAKGLVKGA